MCQGHTIDIYMRGVSGVRARVIVYIIVIITNIITTFVKRELNLLLYGIDI